MCAVVLHSHSEFSARDSLLRVHELPKLAKSLGWSAVALTDHGAVEGVLPFMDACKTEGIRGIAGVEAYISTADYDKYHHLTVLAKNARGWSSMMAMLSAAAEFSKGSKKKTSACPINTALDVLKDVVILSGCFSSPFWRPVEGADQDLSKWVENFGEDFFFEAQPLSDWSSQIELNQLVLLAAKHYGRPVVVTPDCHYGTAGDVKLHEALLALANKAVLGSEKDTWKFSTQLNYLMTPEGIASHLSRAGFTEEEAAQAVLMTDRVAERISDWSFDEIPKSSIPTVDGDFVSLTKAEFAKRDFAADPVYVERIDEELKVFTEAGLGSYFLLVHECLRIFKEQGAMFGPRGSIAGTLVGYVLGLANLDPVEHDLPYWRFWFPGRSMEGKTGSPPDADIDLPIAFHGRVLPLLRKRFGNDNVAQISTIGTFGARSAARASARTFGVQIFERPEWEEDKVVKPSATEDEKIAALLEIPLYRELPAEAQTFAKRLVGRVEKFGAHPGGFVISTEPLTYGRSCMMRRGKETAMCWDMEAAEKLGFLKIDFLGNASIDALQALSKALHVENIESIPLDSPAVLNDFREGRTAGVPQFSTPGMRTFTEMIQPKSFEDLIWINAAYRPGGLAQGGAKELAAAYRLRPESVVIYQEDLMRFCVYLAGFSWADADKVRKIVAKSKGAAELEKWRTKFVNGCAEVGAVDAVTADVLFGQMKQFGEYVFNRAHAAAYSANAMRVAWLKRHNPAAAFTALLNLGKETHEETLLDEADAQEFGLVVSSPDPNKSTFEWTHEQVGIDGTDLVIARILAPLQHAEGGDKRIAKAIMMRRSEKTIVKGKNKETVVIGGLFKDEADFTARMGDPVKAAYRAKDGTTKYKSSGIMRPSWFDHKLWNPSPRKTAMPLKPGKMEGEAFRENVKQCKQCNLRTTCRAPVPPEFGRTNVLILGEAPGYNEDSRGRPFVGKSGDLLMTTLAANGIARRDVTIFNAVNCLPPDKQTEPDIPGGCPWALEFIEHFKPPLVLAVGRKAWQLASGLGQRAPGITKVNGTLAWSTGEHRYGIVPCTHPASILYQTSLLPELERAIKKFAKLFKASMRNDTLI